jgi:hypothetical protein
MRCEDPSHHIFIERERKGLGYLFRDFTAPKVGIAPFHVQHQFNELPRRAFRTWCLSFPRRIEEAILLPNHGLMKFQKRGRLHQKGHPLDPAKIQKGGPQA